VSAVARDGAPVEQRRYLMTRERWEQVRPDHLALLGGPVVLEGVAAVRAQIEKG